MKRFRQSGSKHRGQVGLLALLLSVLVLSFQNCSMSPPVSFSSLGGFTKSHGGGNGDGYEGKPIGTFVRTIPDLECKTGEKPFGVLQITPSENRLEQLSPQSCERTTGSVADSELIYSSGFSIAVGVNDGLYVNENWIKENPAQQLEGWCRVPAADGLSSREIMLTISQTQPTSAVQGLFLTRNKVGNTWNNQASQSVNFTREVKAGVITYKAQAVTLTLQSNNVPSSSKGRIMARLESTDSSIPSAKTLECRLGQSFDGVIWPSRLKTAGFEYSFSMPLNGGARALLRSLYPDGSNGVATWSLTGDKIHELLPRTLRPSQDGVQWPPVLSPNESHAIFYFKHPGQDVFDMMSARLDDGGIVRLSEATYNRTAVTACGKPQANTTHVVFAERPSELGRGCFPRSNLLDGGGYRKLLGEVDRLDDSMPINTTTRFYLEPSGQQVYFYSSSTLNLGEKLYVAPLTENQPARIIWQQELQTLAGYPTQAFLPVILDRIVGLPERLRNFSAGYYFQSFSPNRLVLYDPESSKIIYDWDDKLELAVSISPDQRYFIPNYYDNSIKAEFPDGPYVVDRVTGEKTAIDSKYIGPVFSFSPDSQHLLFRRSDQQLLLSRSDGRTPRTLLPSGLHILSAFQPDWAAGRVAYIAENQINGEKVFQFMDLLNGQYQSYPLPPNLNAFTQLTLSPSKDRVFFLADDDGDYEKELFVLYFDERGLQQLNNRFVDYGGVIRFHVINPTTVVFETKSSRYALFVWKESP